MIDNSLSEWLYALKQKTPAKLWWDAEPTHPATARALKIDAAEFGAVYALAPFRIAKVEGKHVILVAMPCPHFFGEPDIDWLRIETVVAWDPRDNTATILGEDDGLVGRIDRDATTIYGDAFAFLRAYAEARARFAIARGNVRGDWRQKPIEQDETPGLLAIGDPAKMRWPIHEISETVDCVGIDPKVVNRAMLRQANIPQAVARRSDQRWAA